MTATGAAIVDLKREKYVHKKEDGHNNKRNIEDIYKILVNRIDKSLKRDNEMKNIIDQRKVKQNISKNKMIKQRRYNNNRSDHKTLTKRGIFNDKTIENSNTAKNNRKASRPTHIRKGSDYSMDTVQKYTTGKYGNIFILLIRSERKSQESNWGLLKLVLLKRRKQKGRPNYSGFKGGQI